MIVNYGFKFQIRAIGLIYIKFCWGTLRVSVLFSSQLPIKISVFRLDKLGSFVLRRSICFHY
jgi:hypothetical protein